MDVSDLIKRVGGLSKLARMVGRDHSTVIKWKTIPLHHVATIASATNIPREELRPDIWGDAVPLNAASALPPQEAA